MHFKKNKIDVRKIRRRVWKTFLFRGLEAHGRAGEIIEPIFLISGHALGTPVRRSCAYITEIAGRYGVWIS